MHKPEWAWLSKMEGASEWAWLIRVDGAGRDWWGLLGVGGAFWNGRADWWAWLAGWAGLLGWAGQAEWQSWPGLMELLWDWLPEWAWLDGGGRGWPGGRSWLSQDPSSPPGLLGIRHATKSRAKESLCCQQRG